MKNENIFGDDVPLINDNNATILQKNLPIPGRTKEEELVKLFPGGHCNRMSYVYVRERSFEGKKFKFNRVYEFIEAKNRSISGPGRSGYVGLERKYLSVFLLDGVVQDYVLAHSVRDYKSKNPYDHWIRGPLTNYDPDKYNGESWPGANRDYYDYFVQPGDHMHRNPDDLKATLEGEPKNKGVTTRILYPRGNRNN